jgi:Chaperone of endosialidase
MRRFATTILMLSLLGVCSSFLAAHIALAQPSYTINYQGKLTTPTGSAVANGTYEIEFNLYTAPTGGTAIWTETRSGGNEVTVSNGLFSVMLGSVTSLSGVNFNQPLYLGVTVEADAEMTPRKAIGTVPSAFESKQLGGVASSSFLRSDQVDTASQLLTFTNGIISSASSSIARLTTQTATTTNLVINGERFSDLTGTGLVNNSGVLSISTSTLGLLAAGDINTSAELATILIDETGYSSGAFAVFSISPVITGTADFESADFSSTLTLSGAAANIALGSNYLSGDGGDEGIFVSSAGNVGIGTTTPNQLLTVQGNINLSSATGGIYFDDTRFLYASTTNDTVIFGELAGAALTSNHTENVIIGYQAARTVSNTNADSGVYIGSSAGYNSSGFSNVFVGASAGRNNAASSNTFIGTSAGYSNSGASNVMIGQNAGFATGSGASNNLVGYAAGYNNSGSFNDFIGYYAGYHSTASYNQLMGYQTGYFYRGSRSVALGAEALYGTNSFFVSDNNVALGYRAGYASDDGSGNNILIGYQAADNLTTGNNNIIIGYDIDNITATTDNALNIGNLIFGTGLDGTGTTLASGNIGIGTSSPYAKLSVAGNSAFTGQVNLAGTAANIALGSNWLSGDGGDEGVYVEGDGDVTVGASDANTYKFRVVGSTFTQLVNFTSGSVGGSSHFNFRIHDDAGAPTTYGLNTDNSSSGYAQLTTEDGTYRSAMVLGDVSGTSYTAFGVGLSGNSGSSYSPGFVLQQSGNFGIGTSTPSSRLNVVGDSATNYVGRFFNDGNNANRYGLYVQAGADDASGTTYYLDAYDGDGGQVGYLANVAGTFGVTDISDIRTKTNVTNTEIVDATAVIQGLRVVDFNRLQDPDGPRITGFIAQEVDAIFPYAVTANPKTGYLGVMKDAFIPLLVKGAQEQQSTITEQGGLLATLGASLMDTIQSVGDLEAAVTSGLSENYRTEDNTIEAGEIVALDQNESATIKRAETGDRIFGVIATTPGIVLGQSVNDAKPVALSGRVPVKINLEGGDIEVGDAITLSSEAGIGTKATTTARVLGTALEATDEDGVIEIFVNPSTFYAPAVQEGLASLFTPIEEDENDTLWTRITTLASNFVDGVLSVAGVKTDKLCVGSVCVDEEAFLEMVESAGGNQIPANNGGGEPEPDPIPDPTPEPDPEPAPEPTPEPAP